MQGQIKDKRNTIRQSIIELSQQQNNDQESINISVEGILPKKESSNSAGSRLMLEFEKGKMSPEKCLECLDLAINYFTEEKNRTKKETLEFSIAKCYLEKAMYLIEYAEEGLTIEYFIQN